MRFSTPRRSRQLLLALLLAGATTAPSVGAGAVGPLPAAISAGASDQAEARGFYDVRRAGGSAARQSEFRRVAHGAARPRTRALQRALGSTALIDIDGMTGTPRLIARLDGYLTPPSGASPTSIALGFVSANLGAFGLVPGDLDTFRFRDDYVDIEGIHHLSWRQRIGGVPVFGNGLQAAVTSTGRLLTIGGAPVPSAITRAVPGATLSADRAIGLARREAGETSTRPGPRDTATEVVIVTPKSTILGWQTVTMSSSNPALSVHDARTGHLLYRRPLRQDEGGERAATQSTGVAFRYFPGSRAGGSYVKVSYTKKGWLSGRASTLSGNNSHAYSDVNDNNTPQAREEVGPRIGHTWDYRLKPFHLASISFCDHPYPCSWNPNKPFSWRTNRAQNTAQVFFFVNNFHDHLRNRPIGFTEDAGNFQRVNPTGKGKPGDAVDTQTMDGANTDAGLPDGNHLDNANMSTPPDGHAPTMQMYLQHRPGASYPTGDPFPPNNTGDEGDTVYHEYTHGLSNRLVIDPTGASSLGGVQAGSMGEGWSDWYALDYLVDRGLEDDQAGKTDVRLGGYDGAGQDLVRTEAIDCKVAVSAAQCQGGLTGHTGGYTYADYAKVAGGPEVHGDGEIWAQTLWDLRDRLGHATSASLVTRAMETAPYDPSFLDMRNAILISDTAVFGGSHQSAIWAVFARRGLGYYAGSLGGGDAAPAADFHKPPTSSDTGTITGTVTDLDTGAPIPGVPVTLAFQGGNSAVNPTAITATDGTYTLGPVPVGDYGKLVVNGAGYEPASDSVTVPTIGVVKDFTVRRDWAAASGGAGVVTFDGPDYSDFGCGPGEAIDGSLSTGWSSTTGNNNGDPTNVMVPKQIVISLPNAVNVSEIAVDPAATCGDGGSASLGRYKIELSTDNSSWVTASEGTFTLTDRGRLNPLTPTAGGAGAQFLRLTMLGNQTPDIANSCPGGAYSGCSYTDLSEIAVNGTPAP